MHERSARIYDKIYSWKDYKTEIERLVPIIRESLQSEGHRLLDVACGTGVHLELLKKHFDCQGLDISEEMLEVARARNPEITFHHGDMLDFDLGRTFDVVTCLFSSIGYVLTQRNLHRAVASMARHLVPGGVLVIEPWLTPDVLRPNSVHMVTVDEENLKVVRSCTSFVEERRYWSDFHYLISTPEGTEHVVERHEMGIFTVEEMKAAFAAAGLEVDYDADGLMGRGLYIGRKPL
jgi:ubiquinone/menaquinone biosynthesis C-methylase UbiE